jgi:hypothetical protein
MDDTKVHDTDVEKSDSENTAALTNSSLSEEFNFERGVTRAYELKCDLGEWIFPYETIDITLKWLIATVNKCLQEYVVTESRP